MGKFDDIRWKWLEERGIEVYGDSYQLDYILSLWKTPDKIQAVFCESKAGTGKTTLAVLAGAYEVIKGEHYDRIIYVRNAVPIREQGFLTGDIKQKSAPYMAPIADALELVHPATFEEWTFEQGKEQPKLVPITTSFVRGITWKRSFVIIDESQNMDLEELQAIYTRCDTTSKIVSVGSIRQVDNKKVKRIAGLLPFQIYMKHFEGDPRVSFHELVTCYRGWFADKADDVLETVKRLEGRL
ncbi:PhoH family protein [Neobacillus vireti]|uniref:PhoH family protein n=1 Tax=Neobacillus vireti TaxID=220686 RepID=UPI002FFED550